MNEAEWQTSQDSQAMLAFLCSNPAISDRKLRFFLCGCLRVQAGCRLAPKKPASGMFSRLIKAYRWLESRSVNSQLTALTISERYADNDAADGEIQGALADSEFWWEMSLHIACQPRLDRRLIVSEFLQDVYGRGGSFPAVALLHDVFSPFCDRAAASTSTSAREVASAAYSNRKLPEGTLGNDLLAVLADALEETGTSDTSLLAHLRSDGPHYRGCWALDCVLGKS